MICDYNYVFPILTKMSINMNIKLYLNINLTYYNIIGNSISSTSFIVVIQTKKN